jgi:hypothetical protein
LLAANAAYAAEGASNASAAMPWYTWTLLLACAVCAALTVWYWSLPNRKEARRLKAAALLAGTAAVLMGAFNASGMWETEQKSQSINLVQVYGMEYRQQDDGQIMVATHEGIQWFDTGSLSWKPGVGERHDYIAFAPFEGGFYGSGRPGPGSKLLNPLGLVKSTDEGKTIEVLDLGGKASFTLMAASYRKPILYGYMNEPNEAFRQPGLYYTPDEGKNWTRCAMNGFAGDPTALAVDPDNSDLVAIGTRDGLFLSRNKGESFVELLPDTGISALVFDRDGRMAVGGFKVKPSLLQLDRDGALIEEIPLPELKEDAIAHIAHNPEKPAERIISTYEHDVYFTSDGGSTWHQVAAGGKTKPEPEVAPREGKKS